VVRTQLREADGSLLISARPHAHEGEWQDHVKARWFAGSGGRLLSRRADAMPQRAADFTREQHLAAAAQIGLDYGPAFQAVSEGWVDADQVIGRCEPSERIQETYTGLLLHPGVLDTAFQLFIPLLAQEQRNDGYGYVPVEIGRLQFSRAHIGVLPAQIRGRLLRRSPHSLLAEVELFDVAGDAIAVLTEVRFKVVPLRKHQSLAISTLDMPLKPLPLPQTPSALDAQAVLHSLQPLLADQSDDHMIAEVEPLLDTLMLAGMNDSLTTLPISLSQLGDRQMRWADSAIAQGLLIESGEGRLQVVDAPEVATRELWELLLREYPAAFVPIHAVGRQALHLHEWLSQNGALPELNERQWSEIYRARYAQPRLLALQHELGDLLTQQLQQLGAAQSLALAEITAGEMLLTPALAPLMQGHHAEFSFVSASSAAVSEARSQLAGQPQLQALLWDQNRLPVELGLLDLALVHLDFMRPSDVRQLLQQLRSVLRPGGQVLLLGHAQALWLDQLCADKQALLEQEGTLQPGSDLWLRLLNGLGYCGAQVLDDSEQPGSAFLLSALQPVCASDNDLSINDLSTLDEQRQQQTLIWADQHSEALAEQLQAVLPQAQTFASLDALLDQIQTTDALTIDHQALDRQLIVLADTAEGDARTLATQRCAQLRDLVIALEAAGAQVPCTVITSGVGGAELGAARLEGETLPASDQLVAQTAIWGFVRTLMNESAVPLRLIDLSAGSAAVDMSALLQALTCAADEDEQYLVGCERHVPRLQTLELQPSTTQSDDRQSLTLGFDQPGQLRNLRWQPRELAQPGDDDVLVDVKATGLNFRDVMYALGLLSDEAIENGFSGPTLGLEFAGVVSAVGTGVTDFRAGDKVVGFGPASFSTRLITGSETLAHLPGDIGFEAAATIPTTFFTVYYSLKHLARLQPGERVLIHGAAGGVGLAAIQIARMMGAEIYATVGSQSKRDVVRLLGVDAIYDSRSHSFAEDILADTQGQGVDVVLNSLAGEAINQNLRVLRPFGRFLELGKRDFYENTAIGLRPFRNNISYFGIDSDQLMKVQPALTRTLFREMMDLFEQGKLYPLPYTAFSASRVVDAFRYMQQAKQIGKVVVSYPQPPEVGSRTGLPAQATTERLQLSADKTFLVTGGLGGFGLRTAQWLVEKGARHLALASRRGQAEGEEAALIEQLRFEGVDIQAYACDVSNREQLATTLALIEQQQPALGGVVHAATVFADAVVQNMSDAQIEQVLAVKAFGAQHLHELTLDLSLELFVMFSSATTLFGNPGQANYVGANLALEALTQLRRARGLTATCVRWGAIDDAGYLARNSQIKQALQSRMGGNALTTDKALTVLEQMLLCDQPLLGVMEFDWSALARFLPNATAARYQLVARSQEGADHGDSGSDLLAELLQMEPEAQLARVVDELKKSLSQILMLPVEQIDAEQSVYDLGFDSLMGVELITAIEDRFGVQLPAMAISESPSIAKLAVKLLQRIGNSQDDDVAVTLAQLAAQHGVSEHEVKNA
jgi:NADPH:quinone reductase-like Zn-dependent oxidoreductase/acyl carrier protein/SAM-dependent methyltransferase